MAKPPLTRREREIMDIVYRLGRASAQEVLDNLAEPPSYSAVRALLRLLEERGHVRHVEEGGFEGKTKGFDQEIFGFRALTRDQGHAGDEEDVHPFGLVQFASRRLNVSDAAWGARVQAAVTG